MTRLTRWALDRPSITILLMLALVGGGLWAARGLGRELIPDIEPPTATIVVIYPGASADEVTNSVIKPIETALDAITDIEVLDVTATASESFAAITLQAEYGTKQDDIRAEIEDQLATVDLPADANDPEIILFSFADIPAIQGSISGDIDEADLQQLVQNDLVPEIEGIAGVSRVELAGVREDKVYLKLDPDAMSEKGVSIDAVKGALAANDLSFPAGSLETDGLLTPLQVSHRITTTAALEDLVIGGGGSGGNGGPPSGPPSGGASAASGDAGSSRDGSAAAGDSTDDGDRADAASVLPTGPFPIPESVQRLAESLPFDLTLETTDDLTPELIDQLELLAPDVLRDAASQIFESLPPGGAAALPADVLAALPADIRAEALRQGEASEASAAGADDGAASGGVVQVVVVKPGDTVERIADRLGVDAAAVRGDDGEPATTIEPGDLVYVTMTAATAAPASGGEDDAAGDGGSDDGGRDGDSGDQVRLGDIAEVVREPEAASSISRSNGQGSLGLLVFKERGTNTVKVVNDVKARIDELQDDNEDLGDLDVNLVFEQASFITESLNGVRNEGILGGLFAVLVILWFLRSIRSTLIIAVSIPLSVLAALVLMRVQGLSLNLLTLSGLTIAIGRVVDDAIVVIENTYRNLQHGVPRRQAILQGAGEVATAITAATLVTVAVFLPLGFVGGLTREFFLPFGQTVTYALLASLITALTVIPLLASWWLSADKLPAEHETTLQRVYTPILRWALGHRLVTLLIATAIFALSLGLIRYIPQTFLGGFGEPTIGVTVSLPTGASLETTDSIVRLVEDILEDDDAIDDIETTIGSGSSGFGLFSGGDPAKASILATLSEDGTGNSDDEDKDEDEDEESSSMLSWFESSDREDPADVADRLRTELDDLNDIDEVKARLQDADEDTADAEMARLRTVLAAANIEDGKANRVFDYAVSVGSGGGPPAGVYDLQVRGDDERKVRRATALIMTALTDPDEWDEEGYDVDTDDDDEDSTNVDGLPIINLKNNLSEARQTLTVAVDPAKAQAESLSTVQVALALRSIFEGQDVGAIEVADGDDVSKLDVLAVYPDDLITDKAALENHVLDAPGGGKVRLGDIAEVTLRAGAVEITRVNGERAALISGEITDTDTFGVQASAMAIIDRVIDDHDDLFGDPDNEDEEPPVSVGSGVSSSEQQDSFNDLLLALPISILIVYLIMVLEFGSLSVPFAILFSLPFAATGAFIALAVTGRALSLSSLIGMLMLIGIVVTNAIVLLDFVQQLRKRGYNVHDALIEGGRTRVRPIMMTAVATVIALIPQALGFTEGALLASELATTVIGGLTTSTLLTLVVVPVLYSLFAGVAGDSAAMMPPPNGSGDGPSGGARPQGPPPMPAGPVPAIPSPGPRPDATIPPASPFPSAPQTASGLPTSPAGPQPTGGAVPDPTPPTSVPASPEGLTPPTPPSRQPYEGPEVTWSSRGGATDADVGAGSEPGVPPS